MAQDEPVSKQYRYFDTPDGEDMDKKLWCVLRKALPITTSLAVGDVLLVSYPKGYLNTAFRMASVALPMLGIASTFVLATNGVTSLRKKDDHLNWFIGGFIAGSCVGLWRRNRMMGFNMGVFGGILGAIRKEIEVQGWELIPSDHQFKVGGATTCLRDWSVTKERPRNWTTGSS